MTIKTRFATGRLPRRFHLHVGNIPGTVAATNWMVPRRKEGFTFPCCGLECSLPEGARVASEGQELCRGCSGADL